MSYVKPVSFTHPKINIDTSRSKRTKQPDGKTFSAPKVITAKIENSMGLDVRRQISVSPITIEEGLTTGDGLEVKMKVLGKAPVEGTALDIIFEKFKIEACYNPFDALGLERDFTSTFTKTPERSASLKKPESHSFSSGYRDISELDYGSPSTSPIVTPTKKLGTPGSDGDSPFCDPKLRTVSERKTAFSGFKPYPGGLDRSGSSFGVGLSYSSIHSSGSLVDHNDPRNAEPITPSIIKKLNYSASHDAILVTPTKDRPGIRKDNPPSEAFLKLREEKQTPPRHQTRISKWLETLI